jgi:beta-N-acetylhexosaminidase
MTRRAFITGVSGKVLTPEEIRFVSEARPWGLILFARNVGSPGDVAALCAAFRDAIGDADAPVLIDQEGGRVQRLKPPTWPQYPSASVIGRVDAVDPEAGRRAAWLKARLIGDDLHRLGIDVDCAPALDLLLPGASDVIGERAFSGEPGTVIRLASAAMEGFLDAGVLPTIKHMPGQGRGPVDSHFHLPVVDAPLDELIATDFLPFRALRHCPFGMTGHVVYSAIDAAAPTTHSPRVISRIIRRHMGFDGALMTDDLGMKALGGTFRERTEKAIAAGVDLALHCSGIMTEMLEVAEGSPLLAGDAARRCEAALLARRRPVAFDRRAAEAEFADLLALADAGASFRPAEAPIDV